MDDPLKIEYDSDSHREDDSLLMICDKSDDLIGVENDVSYEIRDGAEILEYRLVEPPMSSTRPSTLHTNNNSSDNSNCQYFVLNELKQNRPCLIYPKATNHTSNDQPSRQIVTGGPIKKRDEKRRATHNEVERRRRDKINHWIFKLKELLPADVPIHGESLTSSASTKNTQNDSKSGILIKACEYLKDVQEELDSLKKCLNNSENLRRENSMLKNENDLLQNEIEILKKHSNFSPANMQLYTPSDSNYEST